WTHSASGLPAGLSINSATGLISGTPTAAGTSSVTVTARDGTGVTGSSTFTLTISASGGGPRVRCTTNVALNKTTTASSTENAGTPAAAATDGNTGTRWSSAFSHPRRLRGALGPGSNIRAAI